MGSSAGLVLHGVLRVRRQTRHGVTVGDRLHGVAPDAGAGLPADITPGRVFHRLQDTPEYPAPLGPNSQRT